MIHAVCTPAVFTSAIVKMCKVCIFVLGLFLMPKVLAVHDVTWSQCCLMLSLLECLCLPPQLCPIAHSRDDLNKFAAVNGMQFFISVGVWRKRDEEDAFAEEDEYDMEQELYGADQRGPSEDIDDVRSTRLALT